MKNSKWYGLKKFYSNKKINTSTLLIAILFAIIGFCEILPTLILTCIIDIYSNHTGQMFGIKFDNQNILLLLILLFATFIITYICSQQLRAHVRIKEKVYANDLREQLHNSVTKNYNTLSHPANNGQIINNISHDIYAIEKIYTTPLIEAISPIISGVCAITYLFFLNYIIALVSLVFIPVFIILTKKMISMIYICNQEIKKSQIENNNYFSDILNNFPIISLFNGHNREVREYSEIKNLLFTSEKKQAQILKKYWFLMNLLRVLIFSITIGIAVIAIRNGSLGVGSLLLVFNYVDRSNKPIFSTNKIINDMEIGSVDIEKLFKSIEVKDNIDTESLVKITKIEFKNVGIDLPKFKLKNINIALTADRPNFILGDSGAGKSIAMSLLYKEFDYTGNIYVNDVKIKKINFNDVSVSLQNHYVFNRNIEKNLLYPNANNLDSNLLDVLNLDLEKLSREIDLGTLSNLSGGEKQKISLYRCLSKDAKVYILDEPTNDLDNKTIANLKKYINESKKFYIIITHNKNFVIEDSNCIFI